MAVVGQRPRPSMPVALAATARALAICVGDRPIAEVPYLRPAQMLVDHRELGSRAQGVILCFKGPLMTFRR
eukprot:11932032-Alexandrium_andersonii.AAC.1